MAQTGDHGWFRNCKTFSHSYGFDATAVPVCLPPLLSASFRSRPHPTVVILSECIFFLVFLFFFVFLASSSSVSLSFLICFVLFRRYTRNSRGFDALRQSCGETKRIRHGWIQPTTFWCDERSNREKSRNCSTVRSEPACFWSFHGNQKFRSGLGYEIRFPAWVWIKWSGLLVGRTLYRVFRWYYKEKRVF